MTELAELSSEQRGTIVELARRGPGADLDENVLHQLFALGLIEVHCRDRRLILTEQGHHVYREMLAQGAAP